MARDFSVTPPPSQAAWLLGGLLALPASVITATVALSPPAGNGAAAPGLAVGLLTVAAVAVWTFWGLGRRKVLLEGRQLIVKAAMFSRTLEVGELDIERARVIDLDERTELKPSLKTFGMALPGFQAGWFLLRSRHQAFCLVTSRRRVLWLPTHTGKSLLLSLDRPDALLAALHDASRTVPNAKP